MRASARGVVSACLRAALLSCLLAAGFAAPARAQCQVCECNSDNHDVTRAFIVAAHEATREFITDEFENFRNDFFTDFFFGQNLLAAMRGMTEQLVSTGLQQMEIFGAFLDAQEQMERQQAMQLAAARAHKDYQPDMEMCTLGTASRGLAASYRTGKAAAHVLSKRLQDRELGNGDAMAAGGQSWDKRSRFNQMRQIYCDAQDHNGAMASICTNNGPSATVDRDINYYETVGQPLTIDANLDDNAANGDEPHIFALAAGLYGNTTFEFLDQQKFRDPLSHATYLDIRAVAARRNVAEQSFNSLVGLKIADPAPGAQIGDYVSNIYAQLGITVPDAQRMVGERPSYNALMDMMNKTVFLRPQFYVNLYTKPANVERIGATIRAANLMQDMDRFDSQLRMEMNLSQILESEIQRLQDKVQNRSSPAVSTGVSQQGQPQ